MVSSSLRNEVTEQLGTGWQTSFLAPSFAVAGLVGHHGHYLQSASSGENTKLRGVDRMSWSDSALALVEKNGLNIYRIMAIAAEYGNGVHRFAYSGIIFVVVKNPGCCASISVE